MTAPVKRFTLTPEVYAYFSAYLAKNPAWGIYHVWLDDGNYKAEPPEKPYDAGVAVTAEDLRMWELFRAMTPTQRKRVGERCGQLELAARKAMFDRVVRGAPLVVTDVDHEAGVVPFDSWSNDE